MGALRGFFLTILLATACFASQTPLQKFMNASFEPGQSVSVSPLSGSWGGLLLISAEGYETYLFNSSSGKPLLHRQSIEAALTEDIYTRNNFESRASALTNLSSRVMDAKSAAEKKCMQYIGVDMHPCEDTEACKVSCFAVPQCEVIVHSDGFLEAMVQWNEGRKRFDSLLLEYSDGIDSISADTLAIDGKREVLSSLIELSTLLSSNPLFLGRNDAACNGKNAIRCYEYCPLPDYSTSELTGASGELAAIKRLLLSAYSQPARAGALLNRSLQNEAYLDTRGRDYEQFRIAMRLELPQIALRISGLEKKVYDPQVRTAFSALSNLSALAISEADFGMYRRALSRKPTYEQAKADLFSLLTFDENLYQALLNRTYSLGQKVNRSKLIIGETEAQSYNLQLGNISRNITGNISVSGMAEQSLALDSLEQQLSKDVSEKATASTTVSSGNVSVGVSSSPSGEKEITLKLPSGIPCIPAIIPLLALGLVFFSRRSS